MSRPNPYSVDLDLGIERREICERRRLRRDARVADRRLDLCRLAHGFAVEKLHDRAAGRADLEGCVLQRSGRVQRQILSAALRGEPMPHGVNPEVYPLRASGPQS